jgi:hypothetical protein
MGEKRAPWVVPALAVTILAAVVAAFWGSIVSLILEPLAWLLWAGWRLLASVDQEVWWVILALACAVPVIRLFNSLLRLDDVHRSSDAVVSDRGGRVEHWRSRAAGLAQGDGGRAAFRADLETLAASVAETTRTRLPPELSREPGGAKQASLTGTRGAGASPAGPGLMRWLPGFRRRADEQAIEELLRWMETALEIRDDEHSR